MSLALRRRLRRRNARILAVTLIATLAISIGMAHSAIGREHMGEAVVICLAIGVAAVAVTATPHLGRRLPPPSRRARGHPSVRHVVKR